MATVKQCDNCGKVYSPEASESSKYRFRVSDTEPSLHVLDLCYDCLSKLETFMGGRKHTPGWKKANPHGTPKGEAKVNIIVPPEMRVSKEINLPHEVTGVHHPEAACCCCETGLENAVTYNPVTNRMAPAKLSNPVPTSMQTGEVE